MEILQLGGIGYTQMKINNFILNSDYATLKNDSDVTTISVVLNTGTTFTPNAPNTVIASTDVTIGTANAPIRARCNTSKYPTVWGVGSTMFADSLMSAGGFTFTGPIWCFLYRVTPTTLRLLITHETVAGAPLYTIKETQTITFKVRTFLSPLG